MLRLRDPDARTMLAEMRTRHELRLNPEPGSETVPYTTPGSRKGGQAGCATQKAMIWSGNAKARKPRGRQTQIDMAAWSREVALFCAVPRSMAEMAERFGFRHVGGLRKRLWRAECAGHWPPRGMVKRWEQAADNSRRLTVVKC